MQVPRRMIGTDAFQETPIVEVTRQITKHNYLVMDIRDLPRVVKEVCIHVRAPLARALVLQSNVLNVKALRDTRAQVLRSGPVLSTLRTRKTAVASTITMAHQLRLLLLSTKPKGALGSSLSACPFDMPRPKENMLRCVDTGILSGANGAAGPGADRCAQGRAAAASCARLGRAHGHLRLHGTPAAAALVPGAFL